jgi:hypothetical protein
VIPLHRDDMLLIEKSIDNDLSAEEQRRFSDRITDPAFQAEVKFQRTIVNAIGRANEDQLRNKFRSILSKNNRVISPNITYAIAASLLLLIVATFFLWPDSPSSGTLFQSYYKPYPVAVTRDNGVEVDEAFRDYYFEDYKKAAKELQGLIVQKEALYNEAMLHLMLGNCYLNTHQLSEAMHEFQFAINSTDETIRQHAEWFKALTLLKRDDIQACQLILHQIAQSDSIYKTQATELLSDLQK